MLMQEIEDFLSYLIADRGYSAETVETYRLSLTKFLDFFTRLDSQLTWYSLDGDIIRQWMAEEMQNGSSARYVAKHLSALRSFYRYLLRMDRVRKDPVRLVKNPKIHTPLPTFLKQQEVDRLFDDVEFPDNFIGLRDRTILLTFYHTGLRLSELIGLDLSSVDLSARELKVTGKRNKQRIIPFGSELHQELLRYRRARLEQPTEDTALFIGPKGSRMTKAQVQTMVKHYLSFVTTQKKKSPHVLRHTFATAMLNNGAELEAIKELLGHASVVTTEVYTHTTFADLKKEYEHAHPRA